MDSRDLVGKGLSGAVVATIVPNVIAASIFLFISVIIFLGLFQTFLHRDYVSTTAKIVDIVEVTEGIPHPIYEFDYNGNKVKVESIIAPSKDELFVGSEIGIYYDPDNYSKIEIRDSKSDKIAFIIGSIMLFLAVVTIRNFISAIKTLKKHNYNFLDVIDDEIQKQEQ